MVPAEGIGLGLELGIGLEVEVGWSIRSAWLLMLWWLEEEEEEEEEEGGVCINREATSMSPMPGRSSGERTDRMHADRHAKAAAGGTSSSSSSLLSLFLSFLSLSAPAFSSLLT